jgi:hypothetical protein
MIKKFMQKRELRKSIDKLQEEREYLEMRDLQLINFIRKNYPDLLFIEEMQSLLFYPDGKLCGIIGRLFCDKNKYYFLGTNTFNKGSKAVYLNSFAFEDFYPREVHDTMYDTFIKNINNVIEDESCRNNLLEKITGEKHKKPAKRNLRLL